MIQNDKELENKMFSIYIMVSSIKYDNFVYRNFENIFLK